MKNVIFGVLSFLLFNSCGMREQKSYTVTIAVAASSFPVFDKMLPEIKKECLCDVVLVRGASGILASQIKQGAKYDVFVSADTVHPSLLYHQKVGIQKPEVVSYNNLAVWTTNETKLDMLNMYLLRDNVKIALADPEIAPFGALAKQYLMELNVWKKVQNRLVFAGNINHTNQLSSTGSVQVIFTSASSQKTLEKETGKKVYVITKVPPLAQSALLISENTSASTVYKILLNSPKIKSYLKSEGFLVQE